MNLISFATTPSPSGASDCCGPPSFVSLIRRCHIVVTFSQNKAPLARFRRIRGATTTLIVIALIVLPAAGLASPPDPTWIDGIYDGADFDDVVLLVTDTPASTDEASYQLEMPRWPSVGVLAWGVSTLEGSFLPRPLRGPPKVFFSPCHWSRLYSHSPRSPGSLLHDCSPTPLHRHGEYGETTRRGAGLRSLCSSLVLLSRLSLDAVDSRPSPLTSSGPLSFFLTASLFCVLSAPTQVKAIAIQFDTTTSQSPFSDMSSSS